MRVSGAIVGALVVGACAVLPAAASAATTHHCASVTVGTDRFTHITARGVTCKYVRTVFVPKVDKLVEPHGWAEGPPVHLSATEVKDTYIEGSKKIVFDFTF